MNKEKWLDDNGKEITEEYIIISKTAIQKRIDNLDLIINDGKPSGSDYIELKLLKQILSHSTPLNPVIKATFDEARLFTKPDYKPKFESAEEYISNLKLDI